MVLEQNTKRNLATCLDMMSLAESLPESPQRNVILYQLAELAEREARNLKSEYAKTQGVAIESVR